MADADAEEAAGAERDLRLGGLEAGAGGSGARVKEAGEAGHPVGLDHGHQQGEDTEREGDLAEVDGAGAGGEQGGADREGDDHRRAEVGLGDDQQAGDAELTRRIGIRPARSRTRFGSRASRSARVEDQRHLGQLGGLELQRAGADPAAGAVGAGSRRRGRRAGGRASRRSSTGVRRRIATRPWRAARCMSRRPSAPTISVRFR